jgi:hypothetical protein
MKDQSNIRICVDATGIQLPTVLKNSRCPGERRESRFIGLDDRRCACAVASILGMIED